MDFENYLKLFSLRRYIQNFEKNITVDDLMYILKKEVKEYFEDTSYKDDETPLVLKLDYYLEKKCAYDALKMITTDYAYEDFVLDLDLNKFIKILDEYILSFNGILTDDFLKAQNDLSFLENRINEVEKYGFYPSSGFSQRDWSFKTIKKVLFIIYKT